MNKPTKEQKNKRRADRLRNHDWSQDTGGYWWKMYKGIPLSYPNLNLAYEAHLYFDNAKKGELFYEQTN